MIKIGNNPEISNENYHADREFISSTGLKLMFKDPREFYNQYILGDMSNAPTGASLDFGSYIHSLILEPEKTDDEFAIWEGAARRGKAYEKFKEENIGKIILTQPQANKAKELLQKYSEAEILLDHPKRGTENVMISSFFNGGAAEETFGAEIDGVKIKVRTDYRKEWGTFGSINDVKTTGDYCLAKDDIEKICARWSYDISAALYCDVLEIVTGKPHNFFFLFISTTSGQIQLVKASNQMIENGRRKYKEAIRRLKEARKTGIYFKNEIIEVESPEWDVYVSNN
jgi:exodeoxyribonuclease VIII